MARKLRQGKPELENAIMEAVQIAIPDVRYAVRLRCLLGCSGFRVFLTDAPDLSFPGLTVIARAWLNRFNTPDTHRLIVGISRDDRLGLAQLQMAGVFNVFCLDDPPQAGLLTVIAANERRAMHRRPVNDEPILAEGDANLKNGLEGPFPLSDAVVDLIVSPSSPGVFVLDDGPSGAFKAVYIGRSDSDVNNQLHVHVGIYKRFKFTYCSSPREAFEKECELFHDFEPTTNVVHPQRPSGSRFKCPRCGLFG